MRQVKQQRTPLDPSEMNREQFDRTRQEFDQLRTEEKAMFLVEAAFTTVARGVEHLSDVLSKEFERVFREREQSTEGTGDSSNASDATSEAANGKGPAPEMPPM